MASTKKKTRTTMTWSTRQLIDTDTPPEETQIQIYISRLKNYTNVLECPGFSKAT